MQQGVPQSVQSDQQKTTGSRRRFERLPVFLDGRLISSDDLQTEVRILNISQGGVEIRGGELIKAVAFRPKRYTHRPVPTLLTIDTEFEQKTMLGQCRYLRKLAEGHYSAGFAFAQLLTREWVEMAATASALVSQPLAQSHQESVHAPAD